MITRFEDSLGADIHAADVLPLVRAGGVVVARGLLDLRDDGRPVTGPSRWSGARLGERVAGRLPRRSPSRKPPRSRASLRPGGIVAVSDSRCAARMPDGRLVSFGRRRPHEGADLAMGSLRAGNIVCPWHGLEFDASTGASACRSLRPLEMAISSGEQEPDASSGKARSELDRDRTPRWWQRIARRPRGPRVLIAWWGSIAVGAPTVGDCLAVRNLGRWLRAHDVEPVVATVGGLPDTGLSRRDPDKLSTRDYDALAFVCGPLAASTPLLRLVSSFADVPRLALGVSVISGQERMSQLFDTIVARDGDGTSFDLALAGPAPELPEKASPVGSVALCLRGAQEEYGPAACRSAIVEEALDAAVRALELPVKGIDTVVRPGRSGESEILAAFGGVGLVLTTRLHGALCALHAGIPFVAVDQISNGAKLSHVLGRLGWPAVLDSEKAGADAIVAAARTVTDPAFRPELLGYRRRAIALSEEALEACGQAVLGALRGHG